MMQYFNYFTKIYRQLSVIAIGFSIIFFFGNSLFALGGKYTRDGLIELENSRLIIRLINPEKHNNDQKVGCRFSQGGWIKEIIIKEHNLRPVASSSLFTDVPVYGVPEEFVPPIKLRKLNANESLYLKIGVGKVIKQKDQDQYDTLLKHYDWQTSLEVTSHKATAIFSQKVNLNGYSYVLSKTVSLENMSDLIMISGTLENHGQNSLAGEVYLHPFIFFHGNFSGYWYALSKKKLEKSKEIPPHCRKSFNLARKHQIYDASGNDNSNGWIVVGQHESPNLISIYYSGARLSKIRFWRIDNVFSVEPFIAYSIEPGKTFTWTWKMDIPFVSIIR